MLTNRTVLVTGGAGSIGQELVESLLETNLKTLRIFDSDEYALFQLKKRFKDRRLRFLLGDIKDEQRVDFAVRGVDVLYHLAAAKNIEITEYNVPETIRTNVLGTLYLVERTLIHGLQKFVYVSSDKAVFPTTHYGTTKLLGEHLVLWAQKVAQNGAKYSVVRFGNVMETRGNVFDVWRTQVQNGETLTLTDPKAKRYFWHVDQAVDFLKTVTTVMKGGEIFVPKMNEFTMLEMLRQTHKDSNYVVTGLRGNEKQEEILLTEEESSRSTYDDGIWTIRGL